LQSVSEMAVFVSFHLPHTCRRTMSSCFHCVLAMNTLGAGLLNGAIGWTIMLLTLVAGRTDGMQAWAIMSCKALWLRQNEADVPRRERAEIAMTFS
jgi:hypothetical protein